MAEIPVERKEGGGFPWWLIPLLLLLLLIPFLLYSRGCNDQNVVVDNTNGNRNMIVNNGGNNYNGTVYDGNNLRANGSASERLGNSGDTAIVVNNNSASGSGSGGATTGAVINDVNAYGSASDKMTLVGRNSNLSGVLVNRVLSDRVFTVKSGADELFVMLDEMLDSAGGKEQQIKIRSGQRINLDGSFRTIPTAEAKGETKGGGLNQKEYAQMKDTKVYLHATEVSDAK